MNINTDFRIQTGLFEHIKFLKLEQRLGDAGGLAFVKLLRYVAVNHPSGELTNMDADDIALAAKYTGDAQKFVEVLVAVRFIDVDPDTKAHSLHDWADHNPWAAGAVERSDKGKKAADARWKKEKEEKEARERQEAQAAAPVPTPSAPAVDAQSCYEHTTSIQGAMQPAQSSNATGNDPSLSVSFPSLPFPNQSVRPSPSPDADTAENAAPPGQSDPPGPKMQTADGQTDGLMPKGMKKEGQAELLTAETAASLRPEELLTAFQNSPFWADWGGYIADVLKRGVGRKCSEGVYVRPNIMGILRGTEPKPGQVQSASAERQAERNKAAESRFVTAPPKRNLPKFDVPPDWLPGVEDEAAKEFCRRAFANLKSTHAEISPLSEAVRNEARRLFAVDNPQWLPVWSEEKSRAVPPVPPDLSREREILAAKMKRLGTMPPVKDAPQVPIDDEPAFTVDPDKLRNLNDQRERLRAELEAQGLARSDEVMPDVTPMDYSAPNNDEVSQCA